MSRLSPYRFIVSTYIILVCYFFIFTYLHRNNWNCITYVCVCKLFWLVWLMVLNVTFNNISVISWQSVLLVEEIGVLGENHRPVASHRQTLSHNV